MTVEVRPVAAGDRQDWDGLYAGYAAFYKVAQTDAMRDRVWGWLMDAAHPVTGFVAVQEGRVVGIAHARAHARPLSATTGGFLDDLFVDAAARGAGVAQALIAAVVAEGRSKGWSVIRWITAGDNARARAVYDRVAVQTPWVTYDIKLQGRRAGSDRNEPLYRRVNTRTHHVRHAFDWPAAGSVHCGSGGRGAGHGLGRTARTRLRNMKPGRTRAPMPSNPTVQAWSPARQTSGAARPVFPDTGPRQDLPFR